MAVQISARVWESDVENHSELLVLLCMADWADPDGYCWPSIRQLAEKSRMSTRNVFRILNRFEAAGWISRESGGGRRKRNRYRIHVEKLPVRNLKRDSEGNIEPSPETVTSCHRFEPETVTSESLNGDTDVTPVTTLQTVKEPPVARARVRNAGTDDLELEPVETYKRITGLSCQAFYRDLIRSHVGPDIDDRRLWESIMQTWRDSGWNPRMVPNLIDAFVRSRQQLGQSGTGAAGFFTHQEALQAWQRLGSSGTLANHFEPVRQADGRTLFRRKQHGERTGQHGNGRDPRLRSSTGGEIVHGGSARH